MIDIKTGFSTIEREPLKSKFGFKGGGLSELWQVIVKLVDKKGRSVIGLGVQSVLWSAPEVFNEHTEEKANQLMYQVTQKALELIKKNSFINPIILLDSIWDKVYAYAKKITNHSELPKTFVLNALVPIDNAA